MGADGGSYSLGATTRTWLVLEEPAAPQLGPPQPDEINADVGVWELEFRMRFYVPRSITDGFDDFSRLVCVLCLVLDIFPTPMIGFLIPSIPQIPLFPAVAR